MAKLLALADIEEARRRQQGAVLTTPLVPSVSFSRLTGRRVLLKAESLQRTGSFKIRGAMNVISRLDEAERRRGVVAASAGNHAQGVALAAGLCDVPATVFMPETAAIPKIEATRGYGAQVQLSGANLQEAVEAAARFAEDSQARLVHPYDDPLIAAGQGTLGLELVEQAPDVGTVVIPVGGGGLISGVATAVKLQKRGARVVGVEIAATPTYSESRRAGKPVEVSPQPTVADGIAVHRPSALAFAHIEAFVDELTTVDDGETTYSVALLLERAKLLVEAAGAVSLAALLQGRIPADFPDPVVVVLSGGNIDLLLLGMVVRHGLEGAGRFAAIRARIPDVPGQLARLLEAIAGEGGNVVRVEHHREGFGLPFGMVEVDISVETRGPEHTARLRQVLAPFHPVMGDEPLSPQG